MHGVSKRGQMKEILQTRFRLAPNVTRVEALFRDFRNPFPRKRRRDSDTTQEAPCGREGFFEVHFQTGRASLKTLPWPGGGGVGGGGGGGV